MASTLERFLSRVAERRGEVPAAPTAPRPGAGGSTLERFQSRIYGNLGAPTATPTNEPPGAVMGAVRGLASTLEPLQFAQDAFFGVLAGAIDPDTTISDRLRTIKLGAYLPGGEAPERPASGEELFSLLGFDEGVSKWAGIAADLVVDPLVFGTWLRVGGRLSKIDSLVALGDKVDTFVSPLGMGREVNSVLRRSKTISAWQDARMERLLRAFRDPDSVVFGIQRFGQRAMKVVDFVAPRDAALRLRFGEEVGQQLLRAEQQAAAAGARLTREHLELLQRAKYGPQGDVSKSLLQTYLTTMEDQSRAYRTFLEQLGDPLERDFIEAATYLLAKRQVDGSGVGLLTVSRDGQRFVQPEDIADAATRELVSEARAALGAFDEFRPLDDFAAEGNLADRILATHRSAAEPVVEEARENLRRLVERRAQRTGMSGEKMVEEQRRVVGVFDNYLRETLLIDARLGKALSGYDFVSDMLRGRAFELTGNMDHADRIFKRVLQRGLTQGQRGLDDLMDEATDITLGNIADGLMSDSSRRLERMLVGLRAADDTLARLRAAEEAVTAPRSAAIAARRAQDQVFKRAQQQVDSFTGQASARVERQFSSVAEARKSVLLGGADELLTDARVHVTRFRDTWNQLAGYTRAQGAGLERVKGRLLKQLTRLDDAVERHSNAVANVAVAPAGSLKRGMLAEVINAEKNLIKELNLHSRALDDALQTLGLRSKGGVVRPSSLAAVDPRMAEEMFAGPSLLYDALARLRSGADDIRLRLESALSSKTTIPDELAQDIATRTRRMQAVQSAAKRRQDAVKASKEEARQARKAEDAVFKEQRDRWRAQQEAEAAALGVNKLGGKAHVGKVAREAMAEYGRLGRPDAADALPAGRNTTLDEIVAARIHAAQDRLRAGEVFDWDEVLSQPVTFRELLGGIADMQALKLGDYLEGLMDGHLRRAYGLFADTDGFERYLDKLTGGGLIWSNVLDEQRVLDNLTGFEREAGLIREYHAALKAAGGGRVLKRDSMVQYLASAGVSGNRINEVLVQLHKATTNNKQFHEHIDALKGYIDTYGLRARQLEAATGPGGVPVVRNRALFEAREELNEHMLELLGEHAMASMSLLESGAFANRVLKRQEYFQEAYKVAVERGLVKGEKFTDRYGAVYKEIGATDNALGGFGGKWVHPYLYSELQRMAAIQKPSLPRAFTRFRALVTGGYLAAPSVLAANFAGGFYQAATSGMAPWTTARRMLEVLPEMRKAARGERSELVEEIYKNLDINLTSLAGNTDLEDMAALIRSEAGFGPEGLSGFLSGMGDKWENFLRRPLGMQWAGLEGFQFSENWFKVAAYKEAKERFLRDGMLVNGKRVPVDELRAQTLAAEVARTVVFDYSTLPTSLDFLKSTGVVLFPGFPYYLAGRTIQAALERPGTVAVADRISEAFMNANLDIEEQAVMYLSSPEWLRQDQGVPLTAWEREDGSKQVSVIPMAQLVPTVTVWDSLVTGRGAIANPWAESLIQLGMWGPLIDIASALATGDGEEVPFSGRYGHVVFEAGAQGEEKAAQMLRFLYNTMAPSVMRRGLSVDYQGRAQGLVPSIYRMLAHGDAPPDDLLAGIYSVEERRTRRPDKSWREGIISFMLRSPQVLALDGPLMGIREEMERERSAMNDQLGALRRRWSRAKAAGDTATAEELEARMLGVASDFNGRWREYLEFYQAYAQRRRQER